MIDMKPDGVEVKVAWKSRGMQDGILGAVCVLVIGVYVCMAHSGFLEAVGADPSDVYYNLLVEGFRAGHLHLMKEVPSAFAQLPDPYDPTANNVYRYGSYSLHDLSYYKGRLYLYFGVTPTLVLFWPYFTLTGEYLLHSQAVVIFCAIGFLASVGLLRALWRRYFAEVSVWAVAACALAFGLATGVPLMLSRSDVYEVAISCGYALTMLALGAIWCALHEPERRCRWLAVASLAYGLAVGARPSLLFGAVILLAPVAQAWHQRKRIWAPLMAATGPIILIGLGLMLYNYLRFDSPFEFGLGYQLVSVRRQVTQQSFSLHYLWFNFRVYFLEPVRWSSHFPFVREIVTPRLPEGHGPVESPFGILTNIPLVWLALAAPLAWRRRSVEARSLLCRFLVPVTLLFSLCALTLGFHGGANYRYEVEFLPTLLLLAVAGILGLERALASRPPWRYAARLTWSLLLVFSVAFNLFASIRNYAETRGAIADALQQGGRMPEAVQLYKKVLQISPDAATMHNNLAVALIKLGKVDEAMDHFEQALRIRPNNAVAHDNLGNALIRSGKVEAAIRHFERALEIDPESAEARNDLAKALLRAGRIDESVAQFAEAVRIEPRSANAHYNLGVALARQGKLTEAEEQFQRATAIDPQFEPARRALDDLRTRGAH